MPLLAYTECLFSDIPEDSYVERLFDCSTDMSKEDIRIDFLCILRAHCLKFLSTAISGSATDLLKSIIRTLEEKYKTNATEKDKIKLLDSGCLVLQDLEHEKLSFFSRPDFHMCLQRCYYDIKKSLIYLKKSNENIIVRMVEGGVDLNSSQDELKTSQLEIPGQIARKLSSNKYEDFFDGIKQWFKLIIDFSQRNHDLTHRFWMSRKPHCEDNCTIFFAEHLRSSLFLFQDILDIKIRKACGGGICDILLDNQKLQIPVEAKLSSNEDLWSAIENQLIKQYLVEIPYGIYLVYWFGPTFLKQPPKEKGISTPNSAEELKKMLHEHTVPAEHKERVAVFCIDCDGA